MDIEKVKKVQQKINKKLSKCVLKNCSIENGELKKHLVVIFKNIKDLIEKYKNNKGVNEKKLLDEFFNIFEKLSNSIYVSNNIKCYFKKCYKQYKLYINHSINVLLILYDVYKKNITIDIDDEINIYKKIYLKSKKELKYENYEEMRKTSLVILKKIFIKYNDVLVNLLKKNKDKYIFIIENAFSKINNI